MVYTVADETQWRRDQRRIHRVQGRCIECGAARKERTGPPWYWLRCAACLERQAAATRRYRQRQQETANAG
jgi:hypothetical protein